MNGLSPVFLSYLWGQTGSYEGSRVASVDLAAQPPIDYRELRSLITQGEGEPYSSEKIRDSMAALYRTGRFIDVQVAIQPEPAGLRVTLILKPAFYIGMITFPGVRRSISYPRLLQTINLPSQELYTPERVAEAEMALRRFLAAQGYFAAVVASTVEWDEINQLAHLQFQTTLNQQAVIGKVEITGATDVEGTRLMEQLNLKSGKLYTSDRLNNAQRRIRNYFRKKGQLTHQLRLLAEQYYPESQKVDLSFALTMGPSVDIRVKQAKISRRTLRGLIPIYEENTFDADLVAEGERNLVTYFQSKGYFDATVESHIEESPSQVILTYEASLGSRRKLADISLEGNDHVDDADILRKSALREGGWFRRGLFTNDRLRTTLEMITTLYRNAGFEETKITPQIEEQDSAIFITLQIVEGPQTRVDSLRVEGNQALPINELVPDGLNLHSGQPFSEHLLAGDRDRILAAYLDHGFLSVRFESSVRRLAEIPYRVAVVYTVHEGPRVRVDDVILLGTRRTDRAFLRADVRIQKEDPVSQGRMLEAESRLYNLGIFDWVSVGPRRPIMNQLRERVVIKAHEGPRSHLIYGFGFEAAHRGGNLQAGSVVFPGLPPFELGRLQVRTTEKTLFSPRGSIEYFRRNMRGKGETLSLAARAGRLHQRGLVTYADPHFRGSDWSALFSLLGERTSENPIFTARRFESGFHLEKRLGEVQTLLLRYGFRRTLLTQLLIPELVPPEDRSVRLSTLAVSWVRDTRDRPLNAKQGLFQTLDMSVVPKLLGSSAGFTRIFGQFARYHTIGESLVWANGLRFGLARPFTGGQIPLSERFFTGGSTTLRGFPINGAGPQRSVAVCGNPADASTCTRITLPVGGDTLLIVNSELRFPLPIKRGLSGALFYDGGNLYARVRDRGPEGAQTIGQNRRFTNTLGLGLRYETPFGPIRFDIGRNLSPISGIRSTQFFITLGQAF